MPASQRSSVLGPRAEKGTHARAKFIYDTYRASLMNAKYYGHKVTVLKRWNRIFEIAISVFVAASGIHGIEYIINEMEVGKPWLSPTLVSISIFLVLLKLLLDFGSRIEVAAKLYGGYQEHYVSMQRLCADIAMQEEISAALANKFDQMHERYAKLADSDEPHPSRRLLVRFQEEVNVEIPAESLWWPPSRSAET
jgi:hypothetical protein